MVFPGPWILNFLGSQSKPNFPQHPVRSAKSKGLRSDCNKTRTYGRRLLRNSALDYHAKCFPCLADGWVLRMPRRGGELFWLDPKAQHTPTDCPRASILIYQEGPNYGRWMGLDLHTRNADSDSGLAYSRARYRHP